MFVVDRLIVAGGGVLVVDGLVWKIVEGRVRRRIWSVVIEILRRRIGRCVKLIALFRGVIFFVFILGNTLFYR